MKKQILVTQLMMLMTWSAFAGGVSEPSPCTLLEPEVIVTAPITIYLQDGNTKATVGEASLVSQRTACPQYDLEQIDVRLQLDDEIEGYGIKVKDKILSAEPSVTLEFRLKELVNTSESFSASVYGKTTLHQFGSSPMIVRQTITAPSILFWLKPLARIDGLVNATIDKNVGVEQPLKCALEGVFVRFIMAPNEHNGLTKNLTFDAFTKGSLKLCP